MEQLTRDPGAGARRLACSKTDAGARYSSSIGRTRWDLTSAHNPGGSSITPDLPPTNHRATQLARHSMTLIPKDMTPVYKATIAKGTNAMRRQRAAYVDLLPPCNNA